MPLANCCPPVPLEQVVGVLKKEAMKTQSRELEKGAEYRQLLVQVGTTGLAGWVRVQRWLVSCLQQWGAKHCALCFASCDTQQPHLMPRPLALSAIRRPSTPVRCASQTWRPACCTCCATSCPTPTPPPRWTSSTSSAKSSRCCLGGALGLLAGVRCSANSVAWCDLG